MSTGISPGTSPARRSVERVTSSPADRATSFGQQAGAYDRGRPEYPAEAVAWLLDGVGNDVVDVGAGTGKLTRAVQATGRHVIAVDPDAAMLATLAGRSPSIQTLLGTAENLPLPDASADAVVVGQAWHWVDAERGSREVGRVLRPGGSLGLIWNVRDRSEPWVAEFAGMMETSGGEDIVEGPGPRVLAPFGALERAVFSWTRELSTQQLIETVSSRSPVIAMSSARRAALLAEMRKLAERVRDGDGVLRMPHLSYAFRATVAPVK